MANKNKRERKKENKKSGTHTNALHNAQRKEEPVEVRKWKDRFSERKILGALYCITGASLGIYITSFQKGLMWFPLLGLVFIFIDNGFLHLKYNRITSPRKWEIISVISLLLIVMSMVFTEDITKGVVILSLMLVVGYILTSPLLFQDPFFHEDSKRARNRLRKQKKQKEFSEKETRP